MIEQDKVLIALTTCPSPEVAERLANALVAERLAACVNRLPGVTSTYIWEGRVQNEAEILLIIKTTAGRFEVLKERLAAVHPYELPELVAIPVCAGSERYIEWVRQTVVPIE
jgi:periplasmic divalent cation tolerance protein